MNDARRINVAITRAKSSLFVLGRADSLYCNQLWRAVIDDARSRGLLVPYDEDAWREMSAACQNMIGRIPENLFPPRPN